ncbi:MAG: hypothetical protein GY777_21380 [Candidatus Brocadiaceae bacterium]|nr:hypothetical protein [Candidatus Brocadiaceae bacterium]
MEMEKDEFIKQLENDIESPEFGSKRDDFLMWYNKEGDSIHFKTMDVDIIRKRIDEFLTLYISIEEQKPVGFQLKDIHALTSAHDIDLMVEAGATTKDKRLVSINTLIFKAFAKRPPNISRFSGYTDAVGVMTKDAYNVEIPAA